MSDPIEIDLQIEGTSQAAAGVDAVADKLEGLEVATRQTSQVTDELSQGLREQVAAASRSTQELGGATNAHRAFTDSAQGLAIRVDEVQGRMEAFGSGLATLGGAMQGISAEADLMGQGFQALGDGIGVATAMPGPLGLAMGGLTTAFGLASAAVGYFETQAAETGTEMRNLERDTVAAAAALDELVAARRRSDAASRVSSGGGTADELNAEYERQNAALQRLELGREQLQEVLARRGQTLAEALQRGTREWQEAQRSIAAQERRLTEINEEIAQQAIAAAAANDAVSSAMMESLQLDAQQGAPEPANDNARRRGGGAGAREEREAESARREAERAEIEAVRLLIEEEASWFDQRQWQRQQDEREAERAHRAELQRRTELQRAAQRQRQADDRASQEKLRFERELEALSEKRIADYQQLTGVIADGLTEALVATIAGTESADEAFKGMLASFLAALSQMAGLEAAKNYARAIEFFSTQRYDQGALAIAAGTAWLAVAVASGAGSVAVSAPAAAAPASPESNTGTGGDTGGGTTIVNYNAPVVTAGTRAELGREISGMVDEGRRRLAA